MPWESAITGVKDLISEFIVDEDKKNQINYQIQELEFGLRENLLKTTTTPKVDAVVKLMIATKDVVIPMLRPVGAACMTAFGMYCHAKGISMETATQVIMDGAFPAWGASRHVAKKDELKVKKSRKSSWDTEDEF